MSSSSKTNSRKQRSFVAGNQPLNHRAAMIRNLVVLVLFVIGLGILLFQNSEAVAQRIGQPITKIRMDNHWQSVAESEVREILERFMGTGFFEFDVSGLKHELELHPWIRQATVKKQWPDTISLNLTEEVAIAHWGDLELINQYGEIFRPSSAAVLNLPQLKGPEDSQLKVMEQFRTVNQLFFPVGLQVTKLELSKRGNWSLRLNSRIDVTAGRGDVMNKLARFLDFYTNQPEEFFAGVVAVDLRYDNGIAVRSIENEMSAVAVR